MKILTKLKKIPDVVIILLILFIGILSARTLLFKGGYYIMHDDLQMMRQLQIEKCLTDFQIPCRWVPDMGYGFGFPLFNFYPPLPYLVGQIFRLVNLSFITSVKLNFALSLIVSGFGMYLLSKKFFGKLGGLVSAVFYIWAPYHAVDIYVRGAMNESWALTIFPFIFLFSYKLIKSSKTSNLILLSISYAALLLTHNLMVLIFTPLLVVWVLIWLWQEKAWIKIPKLVLSGVWALGLAAFFTLPALFENQFTWVSSQIGGYYNYTAHFVSLRQLLLSRFWGDGPSSFGDTDQMAFPVGHFHWLVSLIALALIAWRIIKVRKLERLSLLTLFFLGIGWFSAFIAHQRSVFIWEALPFLKYVQFPWRFLTTSSFGLSLAAGSLFSGTALLGVKENNFKLFFVKIGLAPFVLLLIFAMVIWNWTFFMPVRGGPLTDEEKFSGEAWRIQQAAGIYDYLPISAIEPPTSSQTVLAEIMDGEGEIVEIEKGTYWGRFKVNVDSDMADIRINIFDFPGWRITLDGREIDHFIPKEELWGLMWLKVPQGDHSVYLQLYNTPVRTIGNLISLFSWILLVSSIAILSKRKQVHRLTVSK